MKIVKLFTILLAFLSLSCATGKQAPSAESLFLWEYNNGSSSAFLLGTIHGFDKKQSRKIYPLDERIVEALSQSDIIYLEFDKNSITYQEFVDFQNDNFYLKDRSLPDVVNLENYGALTDFIEKENLELQDIDTRKIWVLTSLIHEQLRQKEKIKETLGLESYIYNLSLDRDIPIEGLEHPFSYYSILDQISLDLQIQQLMELIQENNPLNTINMNDIIDAWNSGNQELYHELYTQNLRKYPANYTITREVNKIRNGNWALEIAAAVKSGANAVFAVGASHLIGPDSVIAYLEEQGIRFEQITK